MHLPPGPKAPAVVQLARWIWDPIALFEECEREYGEYFTMRVPGMAPNVVFSDPAAVKALFTVDPDDVRVRELAGLLKPVMGESSVMLVDGKRHLRQRKLMLPPFHGERMRAYGRAMRSSATRAIDRWPVRDRMEIVPEMMSITLDVILESVIGADEGDRGVRHVVHDFLELGTSPM